MESSLSRQKSNLRQTVIDTRRRTSPVFVNLEPGHTSLNLITKSTLATVTALPYNAIIKWKAVAGLHHATYVALPWCTIRCHCRGTIYVIRISHQVSTPEWKNEGNE